MDIEQLAVKVDRLESIEAIKSMKAKYCAYCDDGYDPEGIASLFLEDGVWDAGPAFGRYEGREAIKGFFRGISENIVFAAHLTLNPQLEVDGDQGRGRWRILMPATLKGDQAAWLLATYDEEYARKDGQWYFRSLKADIQFFSPYEKGWAVQPFVE